MANPSLQRAIDEVKAVQARQDAVRAAEELGEKIDFQGAALLTPENLNIILRSLEYDEDRRRAMEGICRGCFRVLAPDQQCFCVRDD